MMKSIN